MATKHTKQMKRLCRIVDNLYMAAVWFAWLFPVNLFRLTAVCLLVLMIILHLQCHTWRIAWNHRLQPVLVLVSWTLCFAAKHGAVPRFLSFFAVLALLLLALDFLAAGRQRSAESFGTHPPFGPMKMKRTAC